jgi:hypothetical protein
MDRASMVWLIRRMIDPDAEIAFLPESQVMAEAAATGATPFHHPQAELRHTGFRTGFDALVTHFQLTDPALAVMALALRGAETNERQLTPWSMGIRAISQGIRALHTDDEAFVSAMAPVLDGLYRFCQDLLAPVATPERPAPSERT